MGSFTAIDIVVALLLIAGALMSAWKKKLTGPAACVGALLGGVIYAGAGLTGLVMLAVFFLLGTAATSWKKDEKRPLKPQEDRPLTRHTGQVFANGGMAAIAAAGIFVWPGYKGLLTIMMTAAMSSAMADTLSSELGMVYGRRFYNIIGLRPDRKGLDGVISLEGLLIGMAGSVVIAVIYAVGYGLWEIIPLIVIVAAGTIGNLTDSLLGATLERNQLLPNDGVNFLNTLTAALVAGLLTV